MTLPISRSILLLDIWLAVLIIKITVTGAARIMMMPRSPKSVFKPGDRVTARYPSDDDHIYCAKIVGDVFDTENADRFLGYKVRFYDGEVQELDYDRVGKPLSKDSVVMATEGTMAPRCSNMRARFLLLTTPMS